MSLFWCITRRSKRIANDVDEAIKTFSNELTRSKNQKVLHYLVNEKKNHLI